MIIFRQPSGAQVAVNPETVERIEHVSGDESLLICADGREMLVRGSVVGLAFLVCGALGVEPIVADDGDEDDEDDDDSGTTLPEPLPL
ncbi:hypothetical protein AB1L88_15645 [Tautonia sp. JC769]|uniref:hypothetical protein n=1 Tax=Tautonia sp. JC769 TaxID=3232135 RepID=UPI0034598A19